MNEGRGAIPGETTRDRLAALAGWLAERGAREVALWAGPGDGRTLRARETDLPGELERALAGAPDGLVELEAGGVHVSITRDACRWRLLDSPTGAKSAADQADDSDMQHAPTPALTVAHVTHEAVVHMGGIGTVLQGLLTSPVYRQRVRRSLLVGPLWDTGAVADPAERLGGDGARVLYSSIDGHDPDGYAARFRPIELAFGVRVVYGSRVFRDAIDADRRAEAEVLLFDLSHADQRRVNEFKAQLFDRHHVESLPFEKSNDFQQWVRLAQPAYAALVALMDDAEFPGVLVSHEYMGMPTALHAVDDPARRFRTVFHGHECTTARAVIEHHPGHDSAFYPAMERALKKGETIEDVFGSQSRNERHQLVRRAHELDAILAVGDDTSRELKFLDDRMARADVRLCYNGVPTPVVNAEQKEASRDRVLGWLEGVTGSRPDLLLTHVTRPVISKGLWRDLLVCETLDAILAERGLTAAYLLLTCGAEPRSFEQVSRMAKDHGWPDAHTDGYPDAAGPEAGLWRDIKSFNADAKATRAILVNQFGFTRETLGPAAPDGMTVSDLRRAADAEFGLSVYEPFGIAPVEPLHAGAIAVVTGVSGCAGFVRQAARELSIDPETLPNLLVADFSDTEAVSPHETGAERRGEIEARECARVARELADHLPITPADRAKLLETGQRLAREMSWDRVCERAFLPALEALVAPRAAVA